MAENKIAEKTLDVTEAAEKLSAAIRFKTISHQEASETDAAEFSAFRAFLQESYPLVHERMEMEIVDDSSLLYKWQGSNSGAKPIVLAAHIDVVPIAGGTTGDWTHPPFSGAIADGFVWGRGTMDCKGQIIAIMEAAEGLLSEEYEPMRTIYLAFGQDEEVGGWLGANNIAGLLETRGVRAEYVLDEGGAILEKSVPGMQKPLATIGVTEKGYLTVELRVEAEGGHSSMPPAHTAIGILSGAIHRLENSPFPVRVEKTTRKMFECLAPELPPPLRVLAAAPELAGGAVRLGLVKDKTLNAMVRTTMAATIIEAGTKENVLPQEARAVVNLRLLPGDSVSRVMSRIKRKVNDSRVTVSIVGRPSEASKTSDLKSHGFDILKNTINEIFPGVVAAPVLVTGMTDARHYARISDSVYRFCPLKVSGEDRSRVHGTDERMSMENLGEFINFYMKIIRNSNYT